MKIPSDAIGSCPRVAPAGDAHEVDIFVLDTHVMLSDHSIRDDALIDDGRVHTLELYTDACRDVPETKGRPLRPQAGLSHVTLGADQVTIRMVTIPDDDGDAPHLVFDHSFERRSGR